MISLPSFRDLKIQIQQRRDRKMVSKKIRNKQLKMLFIVTHRRSGSSLLQHMLLSHPQITGLKENHHEYNRPSDIEEVAFRVYSRGKIKGKEKFISDILVHKRDMPDPAAFKSARFIFFIREPHSVLKEIQDMNVYYLDHPDEVFKMYVDSLHYIEKVSKLVPLEHWEFFTYKDMMTETGVTRKAIEEFLALDHDPRTGYFKEIKKKSTKDQEEEKQPREINKGLESYLKDAEKEYHYLIHLLRTRKEPDHSRGVKSSNMNASAS